jgi:hypothetical protein
MKNNKPSMVLHACNSNTREGGSWDLGQPGLHSKIQSQKKKQNKKK